MSLLGIIRQERYRKRLSPLPFFFTFANATLGFIAVIKALEGDSTAAVYCILAAACMDVFDGRLARALGTTSTLGVELDSLVDGISFCFAPAIIFYTTFPGSLGFIQFPTLITYVCAGLYRLAKFNSHVGSPKSHFSGLPTPMAAFFVSSLVLHQDWLSFHHTPSLQYGVFIAIAGISLLMISSIPFKKHSAFSYRELIAILCMVTTGITVSIIQGYPWLLISLMVYILATLSHYSYVKIRSLLHY